MGAKGQIGHFYFLIYAYLNILACRKFSLSVYGMVLVIVIYYVLYWAPQVMVLLFFYYSLINQITWYVVVNILHMFILYSWEMLKFLNWLITPKIHNSIQVELYCNDMNSTFSFIVAMV